VGGLLGAALVAATYLEEYVWILVIVAIVIIALVFLLKRFVGGEDR
jgi:hypothetical protein